MGKSAAKMSQWMGNPARFADFYNGNVFGGNRVIHPEELVSAKGEIHKIEKDKDKIQKEIHRYRDIIMYWKKYGINLAILAIENQFIPLLIGGKTESHYYFGILLWG